MPSVRERVHTFLTEPRIWPVRSFNSTRVQSCRWFLLALGLICVGCAYGKPLPEAGANDPAIESAAPPQTDPELTAKEVEMIVERVVEEKLAPVRKMLIEAHDNGPALTDIIAGIGYILGLVGLATYIGYRKKS